MVEDFLSSKRSWKGSRLDTARPSETRGCKKEDFVSRIYLVDLGKEMKVELPIVRERKDNV